MDTIFSPEGHIMHHDGSLISKYDKTDRNEENVDHGFDGDRGDGVCSSCR